MPEPIPHTAVAAGELLSRLLTIAVDRPSTPDDPLNGLLGRGLPRGRDGNPMPGTHLLLPWWDVETLPAAVLDRFGLPPAVVTVPPDRLWKTAYAVDGVPDPVNLRTFVQGDGGDEPNPHLRRLAGRVAHESTRRRVAVTNPSVPATPSGTHALAVAVRVCRDVADRIDVQADRGVRSDADQLRTEAAAYRRYADEREEQIPRDAAVWLPRVAHLLDDDTPVLDTHPTIPATPYGYADTGPI
jgi:hypothetical protein